MKVRLSIAFIVLSFVSCVSLFGTQKRSPEELVQLKEQLGREIFFDKRFSHPNGEACSVCHSPRTNFADPFNAVISEGMQDGFFTPRNSPTLTYVKYVPPLAFDESGQQWKGGLFWDGRSNSLEHQLSGPFFNIAEMNNPDTATLINEVHLADYYPMFTQVYGKQKDPTAIYNSIVDALVHYEKSAIMNEFDSKFDAMMMGTYTFTALEQQGYELFKGKANCSRCHSMEPNADGKILFTDYRYENIGVPRNENNPYYTTSPLVNPLGKAAVDYGLGAVVNDPLQNGKFRVPSLRNVEFTWPYFHNGGFEKLEDVVHFLNTRDSGDYVPEISENINHQLTGNLHLTPEEEAALVAFLLTLSDGYF